MAFASLFFLKLPWLFGPFWNSEIRKSKIKYKEDLRPYSKSKLELEFSLSKLLSVNCKFIGVLI